MVARRAVSVWGRETGSKRLFALAEPLAFVPPDPAVPAPVVPPEVVLEVAPVFEFASAAAVLSGPEGGVEQPHSMAVSKLN
ncbi:MAG: hypothetical protein K9J49_08350 [Candidatus Methylopumilus sp.]|nr:hypothetical protein [Candidatus Methylopumilus sp.]